MSQSPDPSSTTTSSLTGVRIAATCGVVLALALVAAGFAFEFWLGVVALVLLPVVPTVVVLIYEAIRRQMA